MPLHYVRKLCILRPSIIVLKILVLSTNIVRRYLELSLEKMKLCISKSLVPAYEANLA